MGRRINSAMIRAIAVFLISSALPLLAQQELLLPNKPDSFRFAVVGDTGTGDKRQYDVARQMVEWRNSFPYELVLMMGDNMYGGESPRDFQRKFEVPYGPLLSAGVKFYAALGNHDDGNQRFYKNFNMQGQRYYTFQPQADIRIFALDSNYMDAKQLAWLREELAKSGSKWKICFFHHPLYSSGEKHGSAVELRQVLEPILREYGVNVVFAGHEHFYERINPQHGIYYFTSGGGAKLRRGNIGTSELTAKGFDTDNHFMLLEIAGDEMYFQTISRTGKTVDSGAVHRPIPVERELAAGEARR